MKTKNIRLFAGVLMFALSMTFMSCDCGRNEPESPAVGTWVMTEWTITELTNDDRPVIFHQEYSVSERVSPMTFRANGTGTFSAVKGVINIEWKIFSGFGFSKWIAVYYDNTNISNFMFETPTTIVSWEQFEEVEYVEIENVGLIAYTHVFEDKRTWTKIQ